MRGDRERIPQDPGEIKEKVDQVTSGKPLPKKARAVIDETGREVSGDYERKQEERAAGSPPKAARPKQSSP